MIKRSVLVVELFFINVFCEMIFANQVCFDGICVLCEYERLSGNFGDVSVWINITGVMWICDRVILLLLLCNRVICMHNITFQYVNGGMLLIDGLRALVTSRSLKLSNGI